MRCVFFGDTHLSRGGGAQHALVQTFIKTVCTDADIVVVLGDLFEFYHGYNGYIYPWYRDTAEALRTLAAGGTAVYHVEGNHEFNMGAFFSSHTGVRCVRNLEITVDGKRTFLSHGDQASGPVLGSMLKSSLTYWIMDRLGPLPTWRTAMACSLFLSKRQRVYNERVRDKFRLFARTTLDKGYDAVILAHTHMPDFVEFGGGEAKKTYINTGGLIQNHSYAEYTTSGGFSLKSFNADMRGPSLPNP